MTHWRWAGLAAAVVLAAGIAFGFLPGNAACPAHPGMAPWAAFQKVTTAGEARAFLTGDCIGAMRAGMWFDALAFIPAYALFLWLVTRAAAGPKAIATAALCLLIAGVVADEMEGIRLLAVIDAGGGTDAMVARANGATWAKELLLALATLVTGLVVIGSGGWRRISGSIAALGGLAAAGAALLDFPGLAAIALAWLTLAATAWIMALRNRVLLV